MERSFGEGYISKVANQQLEQQNEAVADIKSEDTITIAGDVALAQLKTILLILNGSMILVIPVASFLLTKKTLEPIEETFNKQKQFVSDTSHELRTPLTIMLGELDIALKKTRTTKEYQEALVNTREEARNLHQLTEELLFITRNDQSQTIQHSDNIDMTDIVIETTSRLSPLADKKGVEFVFIPNNQRASLHGSATMLKQLITNLLDNAIKFTPKGGQVTISTLKNGNDLIISIKDTGIGMTKQEVSRAYERFYRVDTSRSSKGFGLGLAISKAIVERHHGTIVLASKRGHGTTVTVKLPLSTKK